MIGNKTRQFWQSFHSCPFSHTFKNQFRFIMQKIFRKLLEECSWGHQLWNSDFIFRIVNVGKNESSWMNCLHFYKGKVEIISDLPPAFNPIRDGGCSTPPLLKICSKTLKMASKWSQISWLFLFLFDLSEKQKIRLNIILQNQIWHINVPI